MVLSRCEIEFGAPAVLDVRQLRYFVAVAEYLHFSRAADRLHVAQSALSTQVKQLEAQLGVRLLARSKRSSVTLTDAGLLFLTEARHALRQVEIAESVGRLAGRGMLGHVEIGYVASAAFSGLLSSAMLTFRKERPNVVLRISEMETPRQLTAIAEGELDVGFIRPRANHPDGVVVEVLRDEKLLLAMPVGHPQSADPEVGALADETFVEPQVEKTGGFAEHVADFMTAAGPVSERVVRVRDFLSAVTLVGAGCGIALVPESLRALAMPNVIYSEISSYDRRVELALAYRSARNSPVVQAFIAACLGYASAPPSE
jgi:DNA-binding transcriptional LysR family regulator